MASQVTATEQQSQQFTCFISGDGGGTSERRQERKDDENKERKTN
jgi:hypothetical protein